MKKTIILYSIILGLISCGVRKDVYYARLQEAENQKLAKESVPKKEKPKPKYIYGENIANDSKKQIRGEAKFFKQPVAINRKKFIKEAESFLGTPYVYGGNSKSTGVDCSGMVNLVFDHFKVPAPRISRDYTFEGKEVSIEKARPGDLILFTSPSTQSSGVVGHIGIITQTHPHIEFIHASSGKSRKVIKSELKGYYKNHFVKVVSVLK